MVVYCIQNRKKWGILMKKNQNTVDKNSPEYLEKQIAGGRYSLLLILIFTVVNLILLFVDANRYFIFSSAIPYYATAFCMGMDEAAFGGFGTFTIIALVISAVILGIYLLSWLLSNKRTGWLIVSLVVFSLDTVCLLIFNYLLEINGLIDILFHLWAIFELAQAVRCARKLKKLALEDKVSSYSPEL